MATMNGIVKHTTSQKAEMDGKCIRLWFDFIDEVDDSRLCISGETVGNIGDIDQIVRF